MIKIIGGKGRSEFSSADYRRVLDSIPDILKDQLRSKDILLAGGYIRDTLLNLPVSDFDVFCKTEDTAKELAEYGNGGLGVLKTDYSYTVMHGDLKVQYVYCRPFTTPESLLKEFDFTMCCVSLHYGQSYKEILSGYTDTLRAVIAQEGWVFTRVDTFEQDTKDRILSFRCADYNKGNLSAMIRSYRFSNKGWFMPQEQMAKLVYHYVAYAPAVRWRRPTTSWQDPRDTPTTSPMINLSAVVSSINPTYGSRQGTSNAE